MCPSAHNYPTFGLTEHIITRALDQSTLENLQSESAHICLTHNYIRFGSIARDLVYTLPEKCKESVFWNTDSLTKSGKSTDSFTFLGKSYRFFAEIRHASRPKQKPCR